MKKKIFLVIIFFLIVIVNCAYAKYFEDIYLSCNSKILNPNIKIISDNKIILNDLKNKKIEYCFDIKKINVLSCKNLFYIIKLESNIENLNIDLINRNSLEKLKLENLQTEKIKIKNNPQIDEYKLIIELPNIENINGKINLKVEVSQY